MMTLPPLLTPTPHPPLPRRLLSDLRMEGLLSENALSLLCRPCGEGEIRRRQQIFARMEEPSVCCAMTECLAALETLESACLRLNTSAPALTQYCLHAGRMAAYLQACDHLSRTGAWGELFAETSAYFAHPETEQALSTLREDLRRLHRSRNVRHRRHQNRIARHHPLRSPITDRPASKTLGQGIFFAGCFRRIWIPAI